MSEGLSEMLKEIERLEPKVRDCIYSMLSLHAYLYLETINGCESPIEQLLALAITDVADAWNIGSNYGFYLETQEEIEVLNKKYRADICLYLGDITNLNSCKKLIVECDGHEFHEKAKEQAAKDKQRDRMLMVAGYHVIHFTGGEIWADPYKCAREALSLLLNLK